MEKIININFQGRVIPIEEHAYNNLKQYIDSLRSHFAHEESSDEIINDIENRIAELLGDRLKQGIACIGQGDLDAVVNSIGRLEDIEAAEGEENKEPNSTYSQLVNAPLPKGRFFRNADDKVIAGVCSGIANRMGIDPVIMRVLFVLLFGALFWIYILLWLIIPSQSIQSNVTRRLYRNPDDKVIAGVCGGLAVYFRMESWIPRLVFVAPLLLSLIFGGLHVFWWHWGFGHHLFPGSFFGSTLFILYVILWIALPYATTATDKLEMRGEKIDMNSIKAASQARAAGGASYPAPRRSGLGRVVGILFKAFFLFIAGIIALSLFGVLIGLVFAGVVAIPFTDFLLGSWVQYMLAWSGIILFLGIPLLAIITWLIRRLVGIRSHRHFLGYIFAGLWLAGVISIIVLAGMFIRDFSSKSVVEDTYPLNQPSGGKLYINVGNGEAAVLHINHSRWYGNWDDDNAPFHVANNDSLWLNTVKVNVARSADSSYHVYETRISRGGTSEDAKAMAGHIAFSIGQNDSVVTLPKGFTISNKDKFHNQQVVVMVEVPVGKKIEFNKAVDEYNWFNINVKRQRDFYVEYKHDNNYHYRSNTEYLMTPSGLKSTNGKTDSPDDDDEEDDD